MRGSFRSVCLPQKHRSSARRVHTRTNLADGPSEGERSRVRARLILGFLFFAICLGLGYPGVSRYDPRQVEGLRDTRRYVAMLEGTAGWKTQQELRVLVPFLARPIYRAAAGRVGTWRPEFLALLIVTSVFVAWAAVLLVAIGERVGWIVCHWIDIIVPIPPELQRRQCSARGARGFCRGVSDHRAYVGIAH